MKPDQALKVLRKKAASHATLAKWAKCSRQAASNWKRIPVERVLVLEKNPQVGMTRYEMRQDIFGVGP